MGWSNDSAHIVWTYQTGPRYLCLISLLTVDLGTGEGSARSAKPADGKITLEPFAVTAVKW